MTRFETLNGESLGVTFFSGAEHGAVSFLTQSEKALLWSLEDSEEIINDNNSLLHTVGQLKDKLFILNEATIEMMIEKGWGDRLDSGLALRQTISDEGKLIWIK